MQQALRLVVAARSLSQINTVWHVSDFMRQEKLHRIAGEDVAEADPFRQASSQSVRPTADGHRSQTSEQLLCYDVSAALTTDTAGFMSMCCLYPTLSNQLLLHQARSRPEALNYYS